MPKIYPSDTYVPELGGVARGALTVVVHHPDEVDGLLAVCASAPRPPEPPLGAVFHALSSPTLSLHEWTQQWRASRHTVPWLDPREGGSPLVQSGSNNEEEQWPESDLLLFQHSLVVAQALWRSRPNEMHELALVVSLADPTAPTRRFELVGEPPMFALTKGSIVAKLVSLPMRPLVFCVGLVAGGGATPSERARNLPDRLRSAAIANGAVPLIELRSVDPKTLNNRKLVVFVHGLLSTDAGSFGEIERQLRARADAPPNDVLLAGFPHDSVLTSVKANARDLAQLLHAFADAEIRLVCHSRGGLVARAAAAELSALTAPAKLRWKCVTFGTPHRGAAHPEGPGGLVGLYVTLQLLRGSRSAASVLDALSCWTVSNGFPGVNDLMSDRTGDTFLSRLQDLEGLFPDSKLPMLAIGGSRVPSTFRERMMSRPIGAAEHDLVVALDSSMPRLSAGAVGERVFCDHFSYFDAAQEAVVKKAVNYLLLP